MKEGSNAVISTSTRILLRIVICGMLFDGLIPLSPFIAQSFDVSSQRFQQTLSFGFVCFSVIQLSTPRIAKTVALEKILVFSSMGVAFFCALLSVSSSFWVFSIFLIAMFGTNALGSVAARAALRNALTISKFEKAIALSYSAMSGLGIVLPIAIALSISFQLGWRWIFALLAFILFSISLLLLPGSLKIKANPTISTSQVERNFYRILMCNRKFLAALVLGLTTQGLFTLVMIGKPFILLQHYELAAPALGFTLSLIALINVVGFYISGQLTEKLNWKTRAFGALVVQGISSVLMFHALQESHVIWFVTAVGLVSLSFCVFLPLATALALDIESERRVHASALYTGIQGIGGASLVFFFSLVNTSSVSNLTALSFCCVVVTAIACSLLASTSKSNPARP